MLLRAVVAASSVAACMQVPAAPTCTVSTGATLSFGAVAALASSADVTTNSGSSFWLNCTSEVTAAPTLYATTPRSLVSGANALPFYLSAVGPAGPELPFASPGTPLGFTRDGSNQTVTLHGRIASAQFRSLPPGAYAGAIALTFEY